jgi:type IV pilus assembly protein PilV
MMNKSAQKGVGLMEVLVALLILAIGVLGFAALQFRAMDAAQEATENTVAMNVARDLAERIRINRTALSEYKSAINNKATNDTCLGANDISTPKMLAIPKCNSTAMAQFDAKEILEKTSQSGQSIIVADCVKSSLNCIYIAWGKTKITSDDLSNCIDSSTGTYVVDSKCLVMEAF